jgi:hypothetical protein
MSRASFPTLRVLAAGIAPCIALAGPAANPTAPYNEAVRVRDGVRSVVLPPPVPGYPSIRRPPSNSAFVRDHMVEHKDGLIQCTTYMYEPASCEPSDFGTVQRMRTWVVLRGGVWMTCAAPTLPTRCEPIRFVPKPGGAQVPPGSPKEVS